MKTTSKNASGWSLISWACFARLQNVDPFQYKNSAVPSNVFFFAPEETLRQICLQNAEKKCSFFLFCFFRCLLEVSFHKLVSRKFLWRETFICCHFSWCAKSNKIKGNLEQGYHLYKSSNGKLSFSYLSVRFFFYLYIESINKCACYMYVSFYIYIYIYVCVCLTYI